MSQNGKTPGQAAFEARHIARAARYGLEPGPLAAKWSGLTTDEQANWEASAQAAIDASGLPALVAEILGTLNTASCEGLRPARIHPQQLAEWQQRAGREG